MISFPEEFYKENRKILECSIYDLEKINSDRNITIVKQIQSKKDPAKVFVEVFSC